MNATTFNALAEPSRFRIIELLRSGPLPVGFIAKSLSLRQPQASKHLRVLSNAGLVSVRPHAQQRLYYLEAKPFAEIESWAETFQRQWGDRLDALDTYVKALKKDKE